MDARAVHGNYCHDETEQVLMAVGQVGVNSIVVFFLGGGLIRIISCTVKYVCEHVIFCLCTFSGQ